MKSLKIICLVFGVLLYAAPTQAQNEKIDELHIKLQSAKGEERLEVLSDLTAEYLYTSFLLSEKYARIGLKEAIAQKDTIFQMRFYRKIGGVKQYSSQYDSAVYYFQLAADIAVSINDDYQEALSRLNMGNIYTYTNDYDRALHVFHSSLDPLIERQDTMALALVYNNIGTAYMSISVLDSAEFFLKKSIALKKQLDVTVSLGISFTNLGDVYLDQGDFEKAETEYKSALEIFEEEQSTYNISYICIRLSELYINLNQDELSELYLHRALELAEEVGSIKLKADAYEMLSDLFEKLDQHKKALDYYKLYSVLNDSIAESKYTGLLSEMNMLFEIERQEQELETLNKDLEIKESRITLLWSVVGSVVLLVFLMLYFYLRIRRKNKVLFEQSLKDIKPVQPKSSEEPDEKIEALYATLLKLLDEDKVYLDASLTISKLSELLDSNNNYVSKCINLKFGENFNSIINRYRVTEAKRLIQAEDYKNYTIAAISEMCGFTSLSVFNRSFKKETGITPSYFMKSLHDRQ